jgi:DNA modification methylase
MMVFTTHHALPETALAFPLLRRAALLTWHKRNTPTQGSNVPRFTEEYVWCLAKHPGLKWDAFKSTLIDIPKLATGCMASVERFTDKNKRALHPTQKPLAVMHRLLVVGGSSLCDPFMGTGTSLVAAKQRGMRATGIEIEERYCEIAAGRLDQEMLPFSEPEKRAPKEQTEMPLEPPSEPGVT